MIIENWEHFTFRQTVTVEPGEEYAAENCTTVNSEVIETPELVIQRYCITGFLTCIFQGTFILLYIALNFTP